MLASLCARENMALSTFQHSAHLTCCVRFAGNFRKNRTAARRLRRDCTRISRTSPSWSTARQIADDR